MNGKRRKGQAVIDVIDSGPWITEEDSQRVFDAFFQGPDQSEPPVKGSGLGLSITREYVTAYEGSIRVVTNDGERGGHMQVALPLDQDREAA